MDKTRTLMLTTLGVAIAGFMAMSQHAHADDGTIDLDTKFRAKIIKEKAKQASNQSTLGSGNGLNGSCGSQNIGNVNTGGRIGASPREIFVFAPNAINLVSGQGCK